MEKPEESIKVVVRVRQLIQREQDQKKAFLVQEGKDVCQVSTRKTWTFDRVFASMENNRNIYLETASEIIESTVRGFNATIFAYGQTSSGKTHTMMGSDADPGIIRQAVEHLFYIVEETPDRYFLMQVSYMEIYNEQVMDLLVPATERTSNLKVRENESGDVFVEGLKTVMVTDPSEVFELMGLGERNRHYGATNMNERSSRSHTIFRIHLESANRYEDTNLTNSDELPEENKEGRQVMMSQLNLVDLAGSEKAGQTGAEGARLKEGSNINKSLLMLSQVIQKLSSGDKKQHVNYRDSKLTRILQNSLGGNAKTAIIATITPAQMSEEQTLSTLRFASQAKTITTHAHVNEVLDEQAKINRLQNELANFKKDFDELSRRLKEQEQLASLEMTKELREKLEEERREKEAQIAKVRELQEKMLVSSLPPPPSRKSILRKKERRETWAASRSRQTMSRKSMYAFALHLPPIPRWGEEKPLPIPTIEKRREEEEEDAVFLAPTTRRKPRVKFSESADVMEEEEEEVVEEDGLLIARTAPQRVFQAHLFSPSTAGNSSILELSLDGGTPKAVIRDKYKRASRQLSEREMELRRVTQEFEELQEFTRLEQSTGVEEERKRSLNSSSEPDQILERLRFYEKSFADAEALNLERGKQLHEAQTELEALSARYADLDARFQSVSSSEADLRKRWEALSAEKEAAGQSLRGLQERAALLEAERADFDMKLELAIKKKEAQITDFKKMLEATYEDIAYLEGGGATTAMVKARMERIQCLEAQVAQLEARLSEEVAAAVAAASLQAAEAQHKDQQAMVDQLKFEMEAHSIKLEAIVEEKRLLEEQLKACGGGASDQQLVTSLVAKVAELEHALVQSEYKANNLELGNQSLLETVDDLSRQTEELSQKTSELQLKHDDLAAVNRELKEEIEQLRAELASVIAEKEQAQLDLQTVRVELEEAQGNLEELNHLTEKAQGGQQELEQLRELVASSEEQLAVQVRQSQEQVEHIREALAAAEKQLAEQQQEAQQLADRQLQEVTELKQKLTVAEEQLSSRQLEKVGQQQLDELRKQLTAAEEEMTKQQQLARDRQLELEQVSSELAKATEILLSRQEESEQLQVELNDLGTKLYAAESQISQQHKNEDQQLEEMKQLQDKKEADEAELLLKLRLEEEKLTKQQLELEQLRTELLAANVQLKEKGSAGEDLERRQQELEELRAKLSSADALAMKHQEIFNVEKAALQLEIEELGARFLAEKDMLQENHQATQRALDKQQLELTAVKLQLAAAEELLANQQMENDSASNQQMELESLREKLAAAEEKLLQEKQQILESDERLEELRKILVAAEEQVEVQNMQRQELEQLRAQLEAAEEQLSQQEKATSDEAGIRQDEVEALRAQLLASESQVLQLQQLLKEKEQLPQNPAELAQLRNKQKAAEGQLAEAKQIEKALKTELDNLREQKQLKEGSDDSCSDSRRRIEELEAEVVRLQTQVVATKSQRQQEQKESLISQLSATINTLEETFVGEDGNRTLAGGLEATMMDLTTCLGSLSPSDDYSNTTLSGGGGSKHVLVSADFICEVKAQLMSLQSQLASWNAYETESRQQLGQLERERGQLQEDVARLSAERQHLEEQQRQQLTIISTKMREEMNFQLPALEEQLRLEAAEQLAKTRVQHKQELADLTNRYEAELRVLRTRAGSTGAHLVHEYLSTTNISVNDMSFDVTCTSGFPTSQQHQLHEKEEESESLEVQLLRSELGAQENKYAALQAELEELRRYAGKSDEVQLLRTELGAQEARFAALQIQLELMSGISEAGGQNKAASQDENEAKNLSCREDTTVELQKLRNELEVKAERLATQQAELEALRGRACSDDKQLEDIQREKAEVEREKEMIKRKEEELEREKTEVARQREEMKREREEKEIIKKEDEQMANIKDEEEKEKQRQEIHQLRSEISRLAEVEGYCKTLEAEHEALRMRSQQDQEAASCSLREQEAVSRGLQEDLEDARNKLLGLAAVSTSLREEIEATNAILQKQESAIKVLSKEQETAEVLISGMKGEAELLRSRLEEAVKEAAEHKQTVQELLLQLTASQTQLEEERVRHEAEIRQLSASLAATNEQRDQLASQSHHLAAEIKELREAGADLEPRISQLTSDKATVESELLRVKNLYQTAEQELARAAEDRAAIEAHFNRLSSVKEEISARVEAAQAELTRAAEEKQSLEAQLQLQLDAQNELTTLHEAAQAELESKLARVSGLWEASQQQFASLEAERLTLEARLKEAEQQTNLHLVAKQELEASLKEVMHRMETAKAELQRWEAVGSAAQMGNAALTSELARLKEEKRGQAEEIERERELLGEERALMAEQQATTRRQLEKQLEQLQQQIDEDQLKIKELERMVNAQDQELARRQSIIERIDEECNKLEEEVAKLRQTRTGIELQPECQPAAAEQQVVETAAELNQLQARYDSLRSQLIQQKEYSDMVYQQNQNLEAQLSAGYAGGGLDPEEKHKMESEIKRLKAELGQKNVEYACLKVDVDRGELQYQKRCKVLEGDLEYEKGVVQRLTNELRRLQTEQLETTVLQPRRDNSNQPAQQPPAPAPPSESEAVWSSGSGTLKEFELHDLRFKVKRQDKEMKKIKEHQDFYIDKAREWKYRALKLEKIMTQHGVPVPERSASEAAPAAVATESVPSGTTAAAAAPSSTGRPSQVGREEKENMLTPTEDLQLVLEPGAHAPFKSRGKHAHQDQQDCNTQ